MIATFVTLTTQNLQPDYSEVSAALLTELVGIQRATATGGNTSAVPHSALTHDVPFVPATRDVWLFGIWLVSLGLTLSAALIIGMIKQWLRFYLADVQGSPKDRASIRQFRYMGLSIFGVSPMIELLPILMNASLLLFFTGLVLFSQGSTGTEGVTVVIICLTCALFVFYLGTSILPIWNPQCPYKTSVSNIISLIIKMVQLVKPHGRFVVV